MAHSPQSTARIIAGVGATTVLIALGFSPMPAGALLFSIGGNLAASLLERTSHRAWTAFMDGAHNADLEQALMLSFRRAVDRLEKQLRTEPNTGAGMDRVVARALEELRAHADALFPSLEDVPQGDVLRVLWDAIRRRGPDADEENAGRALPGEGDGQLPLLGDMLYHREAGGRPEAEAVLGRLVLDYFRTIPDLRDQPVIPLLCRTIEERLPALIDFYFHDELKRNPRAMSAFEIQQFEALRASVDALKSGQAKLRAQIDAFREEILAEFRRIFLGPPVVDYRPQLEPLLREYTAFGGRETEVERIRTAAQDPAGGTS